LIQKKEKTVAENSMIVAGSVEAADNKPTIIVQKELAEILRTVSLSEKVGGERRMPIAQKHRVLALVSRL